MFKNWRFSHNVIEVMRVGGIVLLLVNMVRLDYGDIYHGEKHVAQCAGRMCSHSYYMQSCHGFYFRH